MPTDILYAGRDDERKAFKTRLADPFGDDRLETISGPGGMGKTYLLSALLADARHHEAPRFRVAAGLIDMKSTDNRQVEKVIAALILQLELLAAELPHYLIEKDRVDAARAQENFNPAGLNARLNALSAAFRRDLQQVVARQPVVVAFDTFENARNTPVARWIMGDYGLQMPGLICIVAGRDLPGPQLTELSDEDAFLLYQQYVPRPIGDWQDDDRALAARRNKLAQGNPLLLTLALSWLYTTGVGDAELEQLSFAGFQRRLIQWLSAGDLRGGSLFTGVVEERLYEPFRQTLVVMAYLNRRFNRELLERAIAGQYIIGATADEIWVLLANNLPDFFFMKKRPDGEIQLHDKLAEMLRLIVLPTAFDDHTGQTAQQLAADVVVWYDDLIAAAATPEERAALRAEKLAYALRKEALSDVRQPEWREAPEAARLKALLPPQYELAQELLDEYSREQSDVLVRTIANEMHPEILSHFPPADQYQAAATLGWMTRKVYMLEEAVAYWRHALTLDLTAEQEIEALQGLADSIASSNPRQALEIQLQALNKNNQSTYPQPELLHGVAFYYRQMQDLENAVEWYERAYRSVHKVDPQGPVAAMITNDRGYALLLYGDYDKAEAHINHAAKLRVRIRNEKQARVNDLNAQLSAATDNAKRQQLVQKLAEAKKELDEARFTLGLSFNTQGTAARQNPSDMAEATGYYSEALSIFNSLDNQYWKAQALHARGDAHRSVALSLYYKGRLESSATYDRLAEDDIRAALDLCEQYGFVDLLAFVCRRMGRLLHDRALQAAGDPEQQLELLRQARDFFERGLQAALDRKQTSEELENAVEIAFLADDFIHAYRLRDRKKQLSQAEKAEVYGYIQQLEQRIAAHEGDKPPIYNFPVYRDLLEIERGAFQYEMGDYESALEHYLAGYTGLASDPGYGSARCRKHFDHLITNIGNLDRSELEQNWYQQFIKKWEETDMKRGAAIKIAQAHPKLMEQFRLNGPQL